jgi:hypothetical protein
MSSIFDDDGDEFFNKLKSDPINLTSLSHLSQWTNTLTPHQNISALKPNYFKPPIKKEYTIDDVEKIFKLILDKGKAQILFSLKSEDELESTIAKNLLDFYSKMKEE